MPEWRELSAFLPEELRGGVFRRSALAATFAATLELARAGRIELRQDRAVRPALSAQPPPGDRVSATVATTSCGCWKRCCSRRRSRSARMSWRAGSAMAPTCRDCCASWRTATPGAASIWCALAGGWTFRTAPDLAADLRSERAVARRLSRAAVETLAIVAYHQPVTRAEIEAIRGVALARGTLDRLMEAGWVRPTGRREAPGRPLNWVTTPAFLGHFGLDSLRELPGDRRIARRRPARYRPGGARRGVRT